MHSSQPFLLIGITPELFQPKQQKQVNRLFEQGLDYLYIRSRENDAAAWEQVLAEIDPRFYSRLLLPVNAPVGTAGEPFVRHIREAERQQGLVPRPEPGRPYSTSLHHLQEVPALAGRYRLAFYSPVFASISKAGYGPQLTWEELKQQMEGLPLQEGGPCLVGLGGICAENIDQVQEAGFAGAALLGALWQAACPKQALAEIQARVRKALR